MPIARRRLLRFALVAGVTAGFLWLFQRQADLGTALPLLAGLPAWSLFVALAALLTNLVFVALRWRVLLAAAGTSVPLGRLLVTVSAGAGVNNILPARAGDLVRIQSLRAGERGPAFVVAGTLFAERLLDGLVLAAWLFIGSLLLGVGGPLLLAGIALSGGSALGVVLAALAASRPTAAERLARRLPARIAVAAVDFLAGLSSLRNRGALAVALAASAAVWLGNLVLYAAVGRGLGLETGFGGYLALEGVGNLALAVPGTAAGVGSFDYLTLMAARSLVVPRDAAAAYVLAVHALTVIPVTVLGLTLLGRAFGTPTAVPAPEPA
jgi:uncharacterized protein (TIRG00374 family)